MRSGYASPQWVRRASGPSITRVASGRLSSAAFGAGVPRIAEVVAGDSAHEHVADSGAGRRAAVPMMDAMVPADVAAVRDPRVSSDIFGLALRTVAIPAANEVGESHAAGSRLPFWRGSNGWMLLVPSAPVAFQSW